MPFDLKGEAGMAPIVGMLHAAVRGNFERLRQMTDGMTLEEIDYSGPRKDGNSTAQLIRHLLYVDLNWVYRFRGESLPPEMVAAYGPMIEADGRLPLITGKPRDVLIAEYAHVMELLREACRQLTDAGLDRVVTFGHDNEKQATVRWGLWHIADHSRYHQAHINQLRRWYKEG